MERNEIIPKWLCTHYQRLGERVLKQETSKIRDELNEKTQQLSKDIMKQFLNGTKTKDAIVYDGGCYFNISINSKVREQMKEQYDKELKDIRAISDAKKTKIQKEYDDWENDMLSGNRKRSDLKPFSI